MRHCRHVLFAIAALMGVTTSTAAPPSAPTALQGSAFTYQGELRQAGAPVTGNVDMTFALFDAAVGGNQVGPALSFTAAGGNAIPVASGVFTVALDFGTLAFNGPASSERYLRATVNGTTLSPRTKIESAPYALQAKTAEMAYSVDVPLLLSGTTTPTLNVISTSAGDPGNVNLSVASFFANNTTGVASAIRGETNTIFGNFGAAGMVGVSSGTGGAGGLFYSSNASGGGNALIAITEGTGRGIIVTSKKGVGLETSANTDGHSLYAWKPSFATGNVARLANFNNSNTSPVLQVTTTGTGPAARFEGNVQVTGLLSKGAGSFQIDHPLAPTEKYLYHSFVESPDMKNVYDGVATLDRRGEAWIELPDWFEALNETFRYQLTALGAPAPNLYVADEIAGNRFRIAGGRAGQRISWQVTGVRHDAYARAHRIPVEVDKPAAERGTYLYPEAQCADGTAEPDGRD